jgi:hypothetical protein
VAEDSLLVAAGQEPGQAGDQHHEQRATEKNPQNAATAARLMDRSSENFLSVATATLAGLLRRCVRSTSARLVMLAPSLEVRHPRLVCYYPLRS